MPKLDTSTWTYGEGAVHPAFGDSTGPFGEIVLGEQAGLSQFGVRLERLPPGSRSSQRHWHSSEDEFVLVLSGELVLIEDTEHILRSGDAAAWAAGNPVGHCLANRSNAEATILVVGHRSPADTVTYPDHNQVLERIGTQRQYRPLVAPAQPVTAGEHRLEGGQVNTVMRVGDTVRRVVQRDLSLQHELLAHLAAKGFSAAPQFLGHDEQGREILSFVPGTVLHDKDDFSDAQLMAAAGLLRRYHDATADFAPVIESGAEIMCHNDWTPANTTFAGDLPAGMIDFDTACPGSRLWDLTYSAWMWLGLAEPIWSAQDQRRRLAVFVAAYDHPSCTPGLVAACLPTRQAGRIHFARRRGMSAAVRWAENALAWTLDNITNHAHPDGLT